MTPAILNLLGPSAPVTQIGSDAGNSAKDNTPGSDAFATLLAGKIGLSLTLKSTSAPAADTTAAALEAKIARMLKAGASQAEIIATLADKLAASVAQALGVTTSDARAQLQAAFSAALTPPGDPGGELQSVADQTRTLAQRFLQLQDIAKNIVNATLGQPNRIAGSFLDAMSAKETPAQATPENPRTPRHTVVHVPLDDSATVAVTATAVVAPPLISAPTGPPHIAALPLAAPVRMIADMQPVGAGTPVAPVQPVAPPQAGAAAQVSALTAPAIDAGGDGRRVALGSRTALGGNGDTTLGRVLARAALAADAREPVAPLQPLATDADSDAASDSTTDGEPQATATGAVSQFVKSFEAAVGGIRTQQSAPHDEASAAPPLALAGHETSDVRVPFVPGVAPFSIERTASLAATAQAMRPEPVDQSAIVDQVLRGAFMRNTGASSEMRLSLVPETLGDVSVKLVVTAGSVSAHVVAQTPEVRDALVAAQPQLTKSLADAGLKLQSFTVDLSGSGMGGSPQQQGDTAQHGNRARRISALGDDDDLDDTSLDAIPSFGPPILSSARTRDFSYLA